MRSLTLALALTFASPALAGGVYVQAPGVQVAVGHSWWIPARPVYVYQAQPVQMVPVEPVLIPRRLPLLQAVFGPRVAWRVVQQQQPHHQQAPQAGNGYGPPPDPSVSP